MGLFDFFKKKNQRKQNKNPAPITQANTNNAASPQAHPPKAHPQDKQPYLGDLNKTMRLQALFAIPPESRDQLWFEQFYQAIPNASFKCEVPQVIQGPDGFPYVKLEIPAQGEEFQCYVLKHMKDDFLLERGFGVAIFAGKNQPEWVFTYGDIVNFHLLNSFTARNDIFSDKQHDEELCEDDAFSIGEPSQDILPTVAKNILGEFLSQHYSNPKVALICHACDNTHELAFNCTPNKFDDHEVFREVIKQISWFLPRYYGYCALEEGNNAENFTKLA